MAAGRPLTAPAVEGPALAGVAWRRWRAVLLLAVAVGLACGVRAYDGGLIDLAVYSFGGRAVLGDGLYSTGTPGSGLPFTYPPIAALLMVPFAVLPHALLAVLWSTASVGALALVVDRCLRAARGVAPAPRLLVAATAGALLLEPVWQSLAFGQVNLFLLALVATDLLGPERRWSGWLTGLAAGLKLTPLAFLAWLLLTGRVRTARNLLLGFGASILGAFLLTPTASWAYWSTIVWDAGRIGGLAYSGNQSVLAALFRLSGSEPSTLVWFAVAGLLAAAVTLVGVWARRRDEEVLALSLAALGVLLASPVSWSHHWVWSVPLLIGLWQASRVVAGPVAAVFLSCAIWIPPARDMRELTWSPLELVLGDAYVLTALAVAAYVVVRLVWRSGDRPVTLP